MSSKANTPVEWIRTVTGRIPARPRIVLGQILLLGGILLGALSMGIIPNETQAIMDGRAKLCEVIAVHCSLDVARGADEQLPATFRAMVERDPDIAAASLRKADGQVVVSIGDAHQTAGSLAIYQNVDVPIWANDKRWGTVEMHFRALQGSGIWGIINSPPVRLILFVLSLAMMTFMFYLRKMLQHLDPSKSVPPRVRTALDTLAEGLLVIDNEERIVLANQSFADLLGKPASDLLATPIASLPWENTNSADAQMPWRKAISERVTQRGSIMRLRDATAQLRTFSVNCSPVQGGREGEYRGVLASFDDITVLEQKEVELRKSKDVAESANRAKSEFLARMSHEIRTPMNAILGFAEVLRRGYEENETERQEYLETIHSSGQHLLELINDVLDLSKIEAGKLEIELSRCAPHRLIAEIVNVLSVRARQKGIGLETRWEGPIPESIETDPTRLRQVLTNLLGNAIKFTETGAVRVVASVLEPISARPRLKLDVIDSGIGMKPEVLNRIFQPFAQADTSITRRFGGTGLGLSISQQIAEALGGAIEVSSIYGTGSTFTVIVGTGSLANVTMLDAKEANESLAAARHTSGSELKLPPARVLLVEDGVSNRKLISLVLQRAGVTVFQAENGQIGADMALAESFDVILMDMQMPVMDGYTAAALLRSKGLQTPIIALTAHAMRGDEEKCRSAGCTGFLTKPIDMDLLVRTVGETIGQKPTVSSQQVSNKQQFVPSVAHDESRICSTLPTDDPDFCEIVEEFVDRLGEQLAAIEAAWSKGDMEDLARLAHWVKGCGGTAGFDSLTNPAKQLEYAAREKQLDDIGAALSSLQGLALRISAPSGATLKVRQPATDTNQHGPYPHGVSGTSA
jgi:PAS domain S-box-containing protein